MFLIKFDYFYLVCYHLVDLAIYIIPIKLHQWYSHLFIFYLEYFTLSYFSV